MTDRSYPGNSRACRSYSRPSPSTATSSLRWWPIAVVLLLIVAACSGSGSGGGSEGSTGTTGATTAPSTTVSPTTIAPDDDLKLNQIQAIGTHNSFHVAADAKERALLASLSPEQAAQREYTHKPLPVQLETEKVRQIELDIFADSKGGLYADPVFRRDAKLGPYDVPAMAKPGIKVLHEQDVDYHSVCPTLVICLTEVRTWSDAHPQHVPVAINIQFKDGPLIFNVPGQAVPEKFMVPELDAMDREILSVFPRDRIITPDDVRGSRGTLNQAVRADAWPTLGESRGKVIFLMINAEPYRSRYLAGHPNLQGRILFTNAPPGQPDSSYVGVDDPVAEGPIIDSLVKQGYLVRTRADEPGKQGKTDDTTVRDAALASGAQWISTDYPGPVGAKEEYGTDYKVELPGFHAARCNPVTAPAGCEDAAMEP